MHIFSGFVPISFLKRTWHGGSALEAGAPLEAEAPPKLGEPLKRKCYYDGSTFAGGAQLKEDWALKKKRHLNLCTKHKLVRRDKTFWWDLCFGVHLHGLHFTLIPCEDFIDNTVRIVDSSNFLATKRPSTCLSRKGRGKACQENIWSNSFAFLVLYKSHFSQKYALNMNHKAIWRNHVSISSLFFWQFVSSLQSLAASRILETFSTSTTFSDLPIPQSLNQALEYLSTQQKEVSLRNY